MQCPKCEQILKEFMADVEAVGAAQVGREWPDLLVTYNKARIYSTPEPEDVVAAPITPGMTVEYGDVLWKVWWAEDGMLGLKCITGTEVAKVRASDVKVALERSAG